MSEKKRNLIFVGGGVTVTFAAIAAAMKKQSLRAWRGEELSEVTNQPKGTAKDVAEERQLMRSGDPDYRHTSEGDGGPRSTDQNTRWTNDRGDGRRIEPKGESDRKKWRDEDDDDDPTGSVTGEEPVRLGGVEPEFDDEYRALLYVAVAGLVALAAVGLWARYYRSSAYA